MEPDIALLHPVWLPYVASLPRGCSHVEEKVHVN